MWLISTKFFRTVRTNLVLYGGAVLTPLPSHTQRQSDEKGEKNLAMVSGSGHFCRSTDGLMIQSLGVKKKRKRKKKGVFECAIGCV